MAVATIDLINIDPRLCHGQPHIAGTRIRVQDVVMFQRNGWSPEQIVAEFAELRLAQVYAALAYYHDHPSEIDAQIDAAESIGSDANSQRLQSLKSRLTGK